MGKLSKELQKYYTRKGNRIVFANGMSLNQLSLAMWERLGYKEIDASVVSRALSGERLFTRSQLETFCIILRLRKKQKRNLFYALITDASERYDIPLNYFYTVGDELINIIETSLKTFEVARRSANFLVIKQWQDQLMSGLDNVENVIKKSLSNKLLELKTEMLINEFWITPNIIPVNKWLKIKKYYYELYNSIIENGNRLGRQDYIQKANVGLTQFYYFTKQFDKFAGIAKNIDYSLLNDNAYGTDILRGAMISSIKSGKIDYYRNFKKYAIRNIYNYTNEEKAKIYQGIATSESKLGKHSAARKYMDYSWDYFIKSRKDDDFLSVRECQLVKTEIELARNSNTKGNRQLENIGRDAILLASKLGHIYYGEEIDRNLNSLFN